MVYYIFFCQLVGLGHCGTYVVEIVWVLLKLLLDLVQVLQEHNVRVDLLEDCSQKIISVISLCFIREPSAFWACVCYLSALHSHHSWVVLEGFFPFVLSQTLGPGELLLYQKYLPGLSSLSAARIWTEDCFSLCFPVPAQNRGSWISDLWSWFFSSNSHPQPPSDDRLFVFEDYISLLGG